MDKMNKKRRKRVISCDIPQELHERTLELYTNLPRAATIETISDDTKLPMRWLKNFPKATRPSVNRVEVLYNYLSEYGLEVL